ncbi:MAG: hypothetical protein RL398_1547 [Planctomycetota bacterium]
MTAIPTSSVPSLPLGRAFCTALVAVAVAAACAWAVGLFDAERGPWIGIGGGVAIAVATLTLLALGRVFDRRGEAALGADSKMQAMRLQGLLGVGFGAKLAVLAIGCVLLSASGLKFQQLAAFAVAFAVASLLAQLAVTGTLLRDVYRANKRAAAGGNLQAKTIPTS